MTGPRSLFDPKSGVALGALAVVLIGCAIGFQVAVAQLNIYLRKEAVELRRSFDQIPNRLGAWRSTGEMPKLDEAMIEELGTNEYLDRRYVHDDDAHPPILLHLAYYTGVIDAVPHVPDRCLDAGGFETVVQPDNVPFALDTADWAEGDVTHLVTGRPYWTTDRTDALTGRTEAVRLPIPRGEDAEGSFRLRTTEFRRKGGGTAAQTPVFAGYFFIANGRVAVTPGDVKRLAFSRQEQYAYYCKVQFFAEDDDLDEAAFVAASANLLDELLPELMHCLPDWAEVEARSTAATESTE